MLQGCVGNLYGVNRINTVRTSAQSGSVDNKTINPSLGVLSAITHDGWNFRGKIFILLYLNYPKHYLYAGKTFQ